MKVLKFGGVAINSVEKMKNLVSLVNGGEKKIIVFSAFSGMTNTLEDISNYLYKKNTDGANEIINQLELQYIRLIDELFSTEEIKSEAEQTLSDSLNIIRACTKDLFTLFEERAILAQGEIISSSLMFLLFKSSGIDVAFISALDFMRTDKNSEPDPIYIKDKLNKLLEDNEAQVYVTQGYICRNAYGEIDNLGRGGSDFSASLIGSVTGADEIQIWTDVDAMQNNDPRYVDKTYPVSHLLFEEAAELAYFGVKILHPSCILPAKLNNIPVRLLNVNQPNSAGTLISNKSEQGKIKAVAAKDDIVVIRIKSTRMLLAYGFLRKVFEIFESYQTSIDMITTSEVGVSITIDKEKYLQDIMNDLKKFGTVTVDRGMSIICVVGDLDWNNTGFETKIMEALRDIPVRMISYGGSNYNISFLINTEHKQKALQALNDNLFS